MPYRHKSFAIVNFLCLKAIISVLIYHQKVLNKNKKKKTILGIACICVSYFVYAYCMVWNIGSKFEEDVSRPNVILHCALSYCHRHFSYSLHHTAHVNKLFKIISEINWCENAETFSVVINTFISRISSTVIFNKNSNPITNSTNFVLIKSHEINHHRSVGVHARRSTAN